MGKHTPNMNPAELAVYLEKHLAGELHWLLRAASEWHAQKCMTLEITGYEIQVHAMHATFLHARTLFEFLTKPTRDNYYGCTAFSVPVLQSALYPGDWEAPLHAFVMHAQDRSAPQQLTAFDGVTLKDLNEMPVDFAQEIIQLWNDFVNSLKKHRTPAIRQLGVKAEDILNDAIKGAKYVAVNTVTKDLIKERKEDDRLAKTFSIPPLPWEVAS